MESELTESAVFDAIQIIEDEVKLEREMLERNMDDAMEEYGPMYMEMLEARRRQNRQG